AHDSVRPPTAASHRRRSPPAGRARARRTGKNEGARVGSLSLLFECAHPLQTAGQSPIRRATGCASGAAAARLSRPDERCVTPCAREEGLRRRFGRLACVLLCLRASRIFDTDPMPSLLNLNAYLGIQPTALELQSRRMQVLADNLANVDTPNYKARDIDFQAALAAAAGASNGAGAPVQLSTTNARDIAAATGADASAGLKYRVPLAPSLDGNTVDAQQEQAAFTENTVRYQATLTFLTTRFKNLLTAITGS